ncbi:MAG: tRNA (guanosine(46)-N7)-methyltransferase TrmB [Marinilabiliaceae bacterium]
MESYSHVVQAPFHEVFEKDHALKGNWRHGFFKNDNPLVLELGCGKGEYAVGLGRMFPEKNFLGVDIKGNRMHRGATDALNEGLKNVGFLRTHIEMIASFFAPGEVDEIWLTFPDPQIKKTRKRLTSIRFLDIYRRFLKPGGIIHLKTDSRFMYTYTRELLKVNDIDPIADIPDLYQHDHTDEVLSLRTFYEEKWLAHDIPIKYLKFRLNPEVPLVEPEVDIEPDTYRSAGRGVKPRRSNT